MNPMQTEPSKWISEADPGEILATDLCQLAREGEAGKIGDLLGHSDYGAKFRKRLFKLDGNGFAPIHYASRYNQVDVVDTMLKYAEDPRYSELKTLYKLPGKDNLLLRPLSVKFFFPFF